MLIGPMSQGMSQRPDWDPTESEGTAAAESLRAQIQAAKAKARAYREGLEAAGKLAPRADGTGEGPSAA